MVISRGTLIPNACTRSGFSVAARRYEPIRVRSVTNQVSAQSSTETSTTQAR